MGGLLPAGGAHGARLGSVRPHEHLRPLDSLSLLLTLPTLGAVAYLLPYHLKIQIFLENI